VEQPQWENKCDVDGCPNIAFVLIDSGDFKGRTPCKSHYAEINKTRASKAKLLT